MSEAKTAVRNQEAISRQLTPLYLSRENSIYLVERQGRDPTIGFHRYNSRSPTFEITVHRDLVAQLVSEAYKQVRRTNEIKIPPDLEDAFRERGPFLHPHVDNALENELATLLNKLADFQTKEIDAASVRYTESNGKKKLILSVKITESGIGIWDATGRQKVLPNLFFVYAESSRGFLDLALGETATRFTAASLASRYRFATDLSDSISKENALERLKKFADIAISQVNEFVGVMIPGR